MTCNSKGELISLAFLVLLSTLTIYAEDISVASPCSLADAIASANADAAIGSCPAGSGADTIHLTGDITLTAELPIITSDITIEGGGSTISGDNSFRIFHVAEGTLALNQLSMTNGIADQGGAIENEGVLIVSDSSFSNNVAEHFGGAVFSEGMLRIIDSRFDNNRAKLDGGAIASDSTLVITNSSFSDNAARASGGAIADFAELSITKGNFSNNSADLIGGGAISSTHMLNITDSNFTGNTTDGKGGALRIVVGQSIIIDSTFLDNSAASGGGAIGNEGAYGGPYGQLFVMGSTFAGNSARLGAGGAISNSDYNTLSIANSSFTNNSSGLFGGAISSFGELSVANSTVTRNSADSYGGGLFLVSLGTNTFAHLSIVDNMAAVGGGIFVRHTEKAVNLYNSLVADNVGGDCVAQQLSANVDSLIADGSCDPALGADPLLGALVEPQDGSPAYYTLHPDSPAIDAADPDHCAATDQIGTERPQGVACDIGAVEFRHD